MKRHYLIYTLWVGMAILSLPSCVREDMLHGGDFSEEENVIPGLETTISLKVNVPEMSVATRSDMAKGTDSEINSLWVGIFSATTGECTYANIFTSFSGLNQEHGNYASLQEHGNYASLKNIETKSGPSYIVAVGNPVNNVGYQYSNSGDPVKAQSLSDLLPESTAMANPANGEKFTWETYKNIVVSRHSIDNVVTDPTGNLPMSGIYYQTRGNHPEPTAAGWETANETPVVIPTLSGNETTVELPGAIHLRRLVSQVIFNIRAGDVNLNGNESRRIINVVPESYRVYNAPYTSWLHERKTQVGGTPVTNSGDVIKIGGVTYESDLLKANYRRSAIFRGDQSISSRTEQNEEVYSFDFWMLENKRRAIDEIGDNYDAREKERKDEASALNTGLYTALCGTDGPETMNNMAAFVEIRCRVEYTAAGLGTLQNVEQRTANAVYTIHLGGVDPNGGKQYDWNDFAHRRNHKYTYNVTVVDVNQIIVEAEAHGEERRPGIEGVVTDIMERYDLDAHYGVFNIKLTNRERTGAIVDEAGNITSQYAPDGFPFRLEVYYNKESIIIDQTNYMKFNQTDNTKNSEKLWQWIELRPTTGQEVLAEYKPYHKKDDKGAYIDEDGFIYDDDNKTFRLNEIADIKNYPGNDRGPADDTEQWYTVFVNENVYEDGDVGEEGYSRDDETTNNWRNYVNQYPRTCWLNVISGVSKDTESVYIKSKYIITQKSIQSFYYIPDGRENERNINAIGLEYTDETYGFTLRWVDGENFAWTGSGFRSDDDDDFSMINGKVNQMKYLRNKNKVESTSDIDWNKYIIQNSKQKITGINDRSFQYVGLNDHAGLKEGQEYYVPANVAYRYTNSNSFNPNTTYAVAVMAACMNRNRDNNGNGKIDRDEVRWYLPSSGEMVDLVNGRNSLELPFMDYGSNPSLNTPYGDTSNPHHVNTRFHYFSSNRRLLWSEEGITINSVTDNENDWNRMGWHVRCVRALGTHLNDKEVNLTPAFETDNDNNPTKIYPTYFEGETLREPRYYELPPHSEMDKLNRISKNGFEFKKELLNNNDANYVYNDTNKKNLTDRDHHDDFINRGNKLCADTYGTGWRMPNIKEAAVIKLALNNAGINHAADPTMDGTNNRSDNRIYTYQWWSEHPGYQVGNFYASTYREYGTSASEQRAKDDPTGYYLGIVYEDGTEGWLGRAQCITTERYGNGVGLGNGVITYFIRCVRDL